MLLKHLKCNEPELSELWKRHKEFKYLINNIYICEIMLCQHIKINATFLMLTKKFIVMYLFHMILNGASLVYGIWLQTLMGNKN